MIGIITKKQIVAVALVIMLTIACAAGMTIPEVALVFNNRSTRKVPVYGVDRDDKKVAITFDAAWGADKTQGILDILQQNEVRATFFLVGFWVDDYPEMVKKIAESGCDIGNHSRNHLKMSTLNQTDVDAEIDYVNEKVEELTGKKPKFFRAPFGDYNNRLLERLEAKDMIGIQWDVDSLDWKGISSAEIMARISKRVKSGSIILCHNNRDHILEALPLMIANLKNQGYELVPMSELVYTENYSIDPTGLQHKNA